MDIAEILRHILIVLIAAKLAAEVSERLGIPAVVGEIVAGLIVGPTLLNLVGNNDEVLRTLGEIGVILLLLDVGMEMDLGELSKVGKASLLVATVGVIAPMAMGFGAMQAMGEEFNTALFVGAALTATSVGITARVFGDLKALATTEARIVLGAAVADDVMGLVVLTVVVRLVTEGSVSFLSVAWIVLVAVAFLVLGGLVGLRVAPPLFNAVDRGSRSNGTLVAIALAFTLAFAEIANAAQLAPIVGAFVAGIALSKTRQHERIRRELAPVGHLFIPVFFLQIGIDADVSAFGRPEVLRDAAILLVIAAVGKLVAPIGAIGSPGDKALIGLGMLPRGEVGLIFATIGLSTGVLGDDLYASLLLVVLVTTLITPQLLKVRYNQLRGHARAATVPDDAPIPDGGWLHVDRDEVGLAARPPDSVLLPLALDAAILLGRRRPTNDLLDWLAEAEPTSLTWTPANTSKLLDVVERGNARSWRFLATSGVLDRALPPLGEALRERPSDSYSLDPLQTHRFPSMEKLRLLDEDDPISIEIGRLAHVDQLLLATFLADALEDTHHPERTAGLIGLQLGLPEDDRAAVDALLADRELLWAAAHRPGAMAEEPVLQLAAHLDTPERARALYVLSALRAGDRERWELQRLRTLHDLVQEVLAQDELSGQQARQLVERRRNDAKELLADAPGARDRVQAAPQGYILRTPTAALAAHARLLDPPPARDVRVGVHPDGERWWIDVGWTDHPGLLAQVTRAFADLELRVHDAVLATWPDQTVLDSFLVSGDEPSTEVVRAAIHAASESALQSLPIPDAAVEVAADASPWHTVCEVRATDRPGLLHALAIAFVAAGIDVRTARASEQDDLVIDRFEVTDRDGAKVDAATMDRFIELLHTGVNARRRRFGRGLVVRPADTSPSP